MHTIYNIAINSGRLAIESIGKLWRGNSKNAEFVKGQIGLIQRIEKDMADDNSNPAWFHVASLGEYAVIRPLIDQANKAGIPVVLTFFSPTGMLHFSKKKPAGVQQTWYLPLDTQKNAQRFIEAVNPRMAVFTVSEYWLNYLNELKRKSIPTYLVSAKISGKEAFFKWKTYRKALDAYTRIFTIDDDSVSHLSSIGYANAEKSANPLFDNAIKKASEEFSDPVIEAFAGSGSDILVAGSIHTDNDLDLVASLVNNHRDKRFIIVPHEVDSHTIETVSKRIGHPVALYSQSASQTQPNSNVLIIDRIGMLAHVYRYGSMAYIGGGFTPFLHSLLEAVVYGLPVAFGPRTERKVTPQQLIDKGIGQIVKTGDEIENWYSRLISDKETLSEIHKRAIAYVQTGKGATEHIAQSIGLI